MSNSSQHPPDDFDLALEMLLAADSPLSYSFLASIEARLRQFKISSRVEAFDILLEAYLRGKAKQRKGEVIHSPYPWLKKTCFYIVCEHSRKLAKQQLTETDVLEDLHARRSNEQQVSLDRLDDRLEVMFDVIEIFKRQDPKSAQLLQLRECEGLSWVAIQTHLIACNGNAPNIDTLRQQGTRGRKQLRQLFHKTEKARV